jgi:hypothetical protein
VKASEALAGTSAEQTIEFMQPNGDKVPVMLRPYTQLEEAAAIAFAMAFAKERGLESADYGSALFDIGLRAHICATTTLDVDSPKTAREPFFKDAQFVIAKYQPDAILYLHQHQRAWQEKCSPLKRPQNGPELAALCKQIARASDDEASFFFSSLGPSTQLACLRFTSAQWLGSLTASSSPTSPISPEEDATP